MLKRTFWRNCRLRRIALGDDVDLGPPKKLTEVFTLLEQAKNQFAQSRPTGGGGDSMVGDNFGDFMSGSPPTLKIAKSRAGGGTSRAGSPGSQKTSPLLKTREMLALQNYGSVVHTAASPRKGGNGGANQKNQRPAEEPGTAGFEDDIDIDIDDIEC